MPTSTELPLAARLERAVDVAGFARAMRRGTRRTLDRTLHPGRRRHARQLLSRQWLPRSVLFVCHGNVCRSPYAAAVFARAASSLCPTDIRVSSAGFIGPDRRSPEPALAAAERRGVDLGAHRSTLVRGDHARAADVIVVMSPEQAHAIRSRLTTSGDGVPGPVVVVLGDLDPMPIEERTIHDPWDGDAAAFDASFGRIDRCVRELTRLLVQDDAG